MMKKVLFASSIIISLSLTAQPVSPNPPGYWQQKVKYTMNVDMDVQTNRYKGKQKLEY